MGNVGRCIIIFPRLQKLEAACHLSLWQLQLPFPSTCADPLVHVSNYSVGTFDTS